MPSRSSRSMANVVPLAPRRADALANRDRIVQAARRVFSEQGVAAPMDAVATEAGVGIGTVYRNFPDKELLVHAVIQERAQAMALAADLAGTQRDPALGFAEFCWRLADTLHADRLLVEVARNAASGLAEPYHLDEMLVAVEKLLRKVQRSGIVRKDVTAADLPGLLAVAAGPTFRDDGSDPWKLYVKVVLAGLFVGGNVPAVDTRARRAAKQS